MDTNGDLCGQGITISITIRRAMGTRLAMGRRGLVLFAEYLVSIGSLLIDEMLEWKGIVVIGARMTGVLF